MPYAFTFNGAAYTPDGRAPELDAPADTAAYNAAVEAAELEAWAKAPDRFAAYAADGKIVTWSGKELGRITSRTVYRNNLGKIAAITAQGSNGATYHGRYGPDWSQLVRLRRSKS